jgi:hypothetical protein
MSPKRMAVLLAGAALSCTMARAQAVALVPGNLVAVSVQVDGRPASLYPATDASERYYLEARSGSRYAVTLCNRSGERLGVVLSVDGLNAISGGRDSSSPGRMYVLDPWQSTSVQGWRTSLQDVRQFTFVDERRSYAARTGQANEKMGWIEVAVYRERRPYPRAVATPFPEPRAGRSEDDAARDRGQSQAVPPAASASGSPAQPTARAEAAAPPAGFEREAKSSYPGTGWGDHAHDPVMLVSFDPEREPIQKTTLRYEYHRTLVALGILPEPPVYRDRLWQREHAELGFAQPPRW